MRLGLWLPGVAVAAMIAVTSTVLATGWPLHGHGSPDRAPATGRVVAAPSGPTSLTAAAAAAASTSAAATGAAATRRSSPSAGRPGTGGAFQLTVGTSQGELEAAVAPLRATLRSDGAAEPIDPPHDNAKQWNTAAWIEQSAYPASPVSGPSYIYGHACHYHVCPFSGLPSVAVGDTVTVRTEAQLLTYRVCASGISPKADNLVVPECAGSGADLVLVTCQYEHGDTSVDNLVVVATLTAGSRATG